VPPHRLVLVGEYRFARYSLVLTVDELGPGLTALRAQTWCVGTRSTSAQSSSDLVK